MRKAILFVVLVLALGVITVGVASANAGPHGDYTLTTGKCAVCHRAHTAPGADLLIADTPDNLCFLCHSGVANTANTDVAHGANLGAAGARLNGGGFLNVAAGPLTTVPANTAQVWDSTLNGGLGGRVATDQTVQTRAGIATSMHRVEVVGGTSTETAFGSKTDALDTLGGVQAQLECVSCHNPHGSTNYRLLRDTQNGYPYGNDNAHKWIPSDSNVLAWGTNITGTLSGLITTTMDSLVPPVNDTGYSNNDDTVLHMTGNIRDFCATCHRSYFTLSGSATNPSNSTATVASTRSADFGLPIYAYQGTQYSPEDNNNIARYRHGMKIGERAAYGATGSSFAQPLRLAYATTGAAAPRDFTCLTCHFAHGTSATVNGTGTGFGGTGTYWQATGYGAALDSALLFYDGRGVCRSCHQKNK